MSSRGRLVLVSILITGLFLACSEDRHGNMIASSKKCDNLLPLAIGNKWVYRVVVDEDDYVYPNRVYIDSIVIVGDTIIDNRHFFVDHRGEIYRFKHKIIEMSFFVPRDHSSETISFSAENCEIEDMSQIETDIRVFSCHHFQADYSQPFYINRVGFYFANNVGLVCLNQIAGDDCSGCLVHTSWTLIDYELPVPQGPSGHGPPQADNPAVNAYRIVGQEPGTAGS